MEKGKRLVKMDKGKRQRSENWNEGDKMPMQELVRKKVKAIEDKNTDRNTDVAKKKAWEEVEESFNSLCAGGRRSLAQLKSQCTATKVVARKRVAEHRKELKKTGGGDASPEIPVSSEDISVWLPNEFIVDSNDFDSDTVPVQRDEKLEDIPDRFGQYLEDGSEMAKEVNVSQTCPSLSCNSKKKTPKMYSQTQAEVKRFTEFEIQCRKELHELKMEVQRKKNRILDLEYEFMSKKQ